MTTTAARLLPLDVIEVDGERVRITETRRIDSVGLVELVGFYAADHAAYRIAVADDAPAVLIHRA